MDVTTEQEVISDSVTEKSKNVTTMNEGKKEVSPKKRKSPEEPLRGKRPRASMTENEKEFEAIKQRYYMAEMKAFCFRCGDNRTLLCLCVGRDKYEPDKEVNLYGTCDKCSMTVCTSLHLDVWRKENSRRFFNMYADVQDLHNDLIGQQAGEYNEPDKGKIERLGDIIENLDGAIGNIVEKYAFDHNPSCFDPDAESEDEILVENEN